MTPHRFKSNLNFYLIVLLLVFCGYSLKGQFLTTQGKEIVDKDNSPILLKGIGLGGWMLQEPYMMQSIGGAKNQQEYRSKLELLIGETKTQQFYDAWLDNFVTEQDIDSIASWGFNSVRLPMHYNLFTLPIEDEPDSNTSTWLSKGFDMVDTLLSWCEANELYLILDLHAAPGGQGYDQGISDYDTNKPSLWESEQNKAKTVALWGELAKRYHDKQWIGGYDLINEVNWNLNTNELKNLYVRITNEIRQYDTNHILFIEGNWFANDFTGLTPPWDNNMVYSFHKYWNENTTNTIQWVLDMRNQYNVPLWMGESGENSNMWFKEAIHLFESNNIGWAWWPWKRIDTTVSSFSIPSNDDYNAVMKYWKGEGPSPTIDDAFNGMMAITQSALVDNAIYNKGVVDAMLRQPSDDSLEPFAANTVPGYIHATHYDMGGQGIAYYDQEYGNYAGSGGTSSWNLGWAFRNDGVDINSDHSNSPNSNGYSVGYVNDKEWIKYTIQVEQAGHYTIETVYAAPNSGGKIRYELNDVPITPLISLSPTGGYDSFNTNTTLTSFLEIGEYVLKMRIAGSSEFNIESFTFSLSANQTPTFSTVGAITKKNDTQIQLSFNKPLDSTSIDPSHFNLTVNGDNQNITSVAFDPNNSNVVIVTVEEYLSFYDEIYISYTGDSIVSSSSEVLPTFTNLNVENLLEELNVIPGKIEAELFNTQNGVGTEDTTDAGLGKNINNLHPGDFTTYEVDIKQESYFLIQARVATERDNVRFSMEIIDENNVVFYQSFDVPNTGSWQSWQTIEKESLLPAGKYTLKINILGSEFNINWFNFITQDTSNLLAIPGLVEAEAYNSQEGMTTTTTSDTSGEQELGYLNEGDYALYSVNIAQAGTYNIRSRVATDYNDAIFDLTLEDESGLSYFLTSVTTSRTGGWTTWATVSHQAVLPKGNFTLKMTSANSSVNINWYDFEFISTDTQPILIPGIVQAEDYTSQSGVAVEACSDTGGGQNLNYIDQGDYVNYTISIQNTGFYTVQARVAGYDTSSFNLVLSKPNSPDQVLETFTTPQNNGWQNWETIEKEILLQAGEYTLTLNILDGEFNINWLNFIYDEDGGAKIPGVVQAEDYWEQYGLITENCFDTNGGRNLSYMHQGDYATYLVNVNTSGKYNVKARVSSSYNGGRFNLIFVNGATESFTINNFQVPNTGGWQSWQDLNKEFDLTAGNYSMTMNVLGNQFNLNWIEFELLDPLSNTSFDNNLLNLYPNPAQESVTLNSNSVISHIKVLDLFCRTIHEQNIQNKQSVQLDLAKYPKGLYLIEVISENTTKILKLIKN